MTAGTSTSQDPFLGREILNGQFHILQKIGTGGMGSVYKALQSDMNRMVAVKILHPKLVGRKDLASRFRREARAMSHLTHPNTVKVFLYGELEDGSLYIVMEFLEGKNLNQTVRTEGPLSLERAINVLVQVCGALEEAHRAGIIHRDLKPENIFLCQQGGMTDYAKVLDFGLAKVTEREMRPGSLILTQEGMVFGTPEFMSPEQAQGQALTAGSDIYSLACILYELLTGKLPFDARNAMEFIQLHVTRPPININARAPEKNFPPQLWPAIAKALEKRPQDRYATALEFADALQSVIGVQRHPSGQNLGSMSNMKAVIPTPNPLPAPAIPRAEVSTPLPPPPGQNGSNRPRPQSDRPASVRVPPTPSLRPSQRSTGISTQSVMMIAAVCVVIGAAIMGVVMKMLR